MGNSLPLDVDKLSFAASKMLQTNFVSGIKVHLYHETI